MTAAGNLRGVAGEYDDDPDISSGPPYDLYKIDARYYRPGEGRWTQRDPLNQMAGLSPTIGNPYAYAGCNGVNKTNPSGMLGRPSWCGFSGEAAGTDAGVGWGITWSRFRYSGPKMIGEFAGVVEGLAAGFVGVVSFGIYAVECYGDNPNNTFLDIPDERPDIQIGEATNFSWRAGAGDW